MPNTLSEKVSLLSGSHSEIANSTFLGTKECMSNECFCHPTILQFLRAKCILDYCLQKASNLLYRLLEVKQLKKKMLIATLNLIVVLTIVLMSHAKCDSDVTMNPPFERVSTVTQKTLRLQHGCAYFQ